MKFKDRTYGVLLGLAIGDALGMPIDGLSHQNVRTFYKGIKEFRDDVKREDLHAGQWTVHTQRALALSKTWCATTTREERVQAYKTDVERLSLRRRSHSGTADLAAAISPLGVVAHVEVWDVSRVLNELSPLSTDAEALVAAFAQIFAIQQALGSHSRPFDGRAFLLHVAKQVEAVEVELQIKPDISGALIRLPDHLTDFPLDLQDLCGGTGSAAKEAVPFAMAMAARGPFLPEATLLSAINVGGASSAVGAICGALLGAFNGADAFPEEWISGLEAVDELQKCAGALIGSLATFH